MRIASGIEPPEPPIQVFLCPHNFKSAYLWLDKSLIVVVCCSRENAVMVFSEPGKVLDNGSATSHHFLFLTYNDVSILMSSTMLHMTNAGAANSSTSFRPVRITNQQDGPRVASARELYDTLGFEGSQWSRWHKKNIAENPYAKQGDDWDVLDVKSSSNNGLPTADYVLTIDFAKRLCMLARTYQGEAIRRYFVQCERDLLALNSDNPKIASLIKLVNKLTDKVVSLESKVDQMSKGQEKYFDTQVVSTLSVEKTALLIKREKILSAVTTKIRCSLGLTWKDFWDRFETAYNVDIRGLQQNKGELTLDMAIRNGYINELWEFINLA